MELIKNLICSIQDPLHINIDMDGIENPLLPETSSEVENEIHEELNRSIDIDMDGIEDPLLPVTSGAEDGQMKKVKAKRH